ncbi:UNVERIFIED_CONTAM: hypothetical protein HDU68_009930 [Siphonaria sp. JEL0065]|nr:hypothetical protein HDU68_009930 [Siphonaria sp. JEL0065]
MKEATVGDKSLAMPVSLKLRIAMAITTPIIILTVVCALLSSKLDESTPNTGTFGQMPHLLVNGSGSSMMANTYWRSLASFSTYLQKEQSSYILDTSYLSVGSGVGRSDFFNAFGLFGATDSDVSASDLKSFLPDDGTGYSNVTKYIDSRAPQHLGSLLLPVLGGALAIVHNVPGISDSNPLILNATVLGDMFCGAISWWNDIAIQQLNPTLSLPAAQIKIIGRGDSSGSTQVFTSYLSVHSSKFKSKIGVSSLPKWPSTVILGNTASELIYVSSNVKYSLTYAPMEAVMQVKSIGQNPQIAGIYNSNQVVTFPSLNSTIAAMQAAALQAPFSRHNYLNIYDIPDPNAYPIALMSFLLIRENYYYFTSGSQYECDRIKAMIYFWYFSMTDPSTRNENLLNGWVPMTAALLEDNMRALGFVTCNQRNIMQELNTDFQRKQFYREKYYNWDFAISFWSNTSKFESANIGSALYLVFYVGLFLSNAIPFGVNMFLYYQKGDDDHTSDISARASKAIRTGSVVAKSLATEEGIRNDADNDDDDDDDEKDAKMAGKIKFTIQNQLAILTQFITCFQILYLCMNRSVVIQGNIYVDVISYLGLIPDWYAYYIILLITVLLWLGCILYTTYFYGILEEYYPRKLINLTHFHAFLADFLPNFAVVMYSPSVELLSKVFDCRLSTYEWKYISSYDETCFVGHHWTMLILSLVLACAFTNSVVRYSKVLKLLRKQFDFKDQEWCIYVDSVAKTFILILYFNIPNTYFLATTTTLLVILSLCSLIGKPNSIFWYNYFRGGMYFYCSIVGAILLAFEVKTSVTDYKTRELVCSSLSLAILVATCLVAVLTYLFLLRKYKLGMSKNEIQMKEEELKRFFAAFGDDDAGSDLSGALNDASHITVQAGVTGNDSVSPEKRNSAPAPPMNTKLYGSGSIANPSGSMSNLSSGQFSSSQWKQFNSMILLAKKIDILNKEEYKYVKLAIKFEGKHNMVHFEAHCMASLTLFT